MKSSHRFYKGCYRVARVVLGLFYGLKAHGTERIPQGPYIACANHSSILDPFFLAFAFGLSNHMHIIAKAELYKVPVISAIMRKLGTIRVDRGIPDINSVKETLSYLNKGEKVAIFPEGTRTPVENAVAAKSGAVKIAQRANVPVIPVFIPRKKPLFRKIHIVIGEPYYVETHNGKRSSEEYIRLADVLMNKIEALNPIQELHEENS